MNIFNFVSQSPTTKVINIINNKNKIVMNFCLILYFVKYRKASRNNLKTNFLLLFYNRKALFMLFIYFYLRCCYRNNSVAVRRTPHPVPEAFFMYLSNQITFMEFQTFHLRVLDRCPCWGIYRLGSLFSTAQLLLALFSPSLSLLLPGPEIEIIITTV